MMDVSDGLLIDAARMAEASGLGVTIDLAAVPLSDAYRAFAGDDRAARVTAVTRSEEHTSELQSLMRISYAVFCLKQKKHTMSSTLIQKLSKVNRSNPQSILRITTAY